MFKLILYFYVTGFQVTYEPFDSMAVCQAFQKTLHAEVQIELKREKQPSKYVMGCFFVPDHVKGYRL